MRINEFNVIMIHNHEVGSSILPLATSRQGGFRRFNSEPLFYLRHNLRRFRLYITQYIKKNKKCFVGATFLHFVISFYI